MTLTEALINSAIEGFCPGCGPTLKISEAVLDQDKRITTTKTCECCGWEITILSATEVFFGNAPLIPGTGNPYRCALDYPEHREAWKKFQEPYLKASGTQAEPMDSLEQLQEVSNQDPYHSLSGKEECYSCKNFSVAVLYNLANFIDPAKREQETRLATHKIVESFDEDSLRYKNLNSFREPRALYLCCECFIVLMGADSHPYPKIEDEIR